MVHLREISRFHIKNMNFRVLRNFAKISQKFQNFVEISKFLARAYAHGALYSTPLSLYLPHALSFSKRGPALRAVVADHHGFLYVVGEGHVLGGPEERLE